MLPVRRKQRCELCQRLTPTQARPLRVVCLDEEDCRRCMNECEAFRQALHALALKRGHLTRTARKTVNPWDQTISAPPERPDPDELIRTARKAPRS